MLTLASAARLLRVTPRSAQSNMDKLIAAGILRETTGKQRNRVYSAWRIIEIAEAARA